MNKKISQEDNKPDYSKLRTAADTHQAVVDMQNAAPKDSDVHQPANSGVPDVTKTVRPADMPTAQKPDYSAAIKRMGFGQQTKD